MAFYPFHCTPMSGSFQMEETVYKIKPDELIPNNSIIVFDLKISLTSKNISPLFLRAQTTGHWPVCLSCGRGDLGRATLRFRQRQPKARNLSENAFFHGQKGKLGGLPLVVFVMLKLGNILVILVRLPAPAACMALFYLRWRLSFYNSYFTELF